MANKRVSELNELSAINVKAGDLLYIVDTDISVLESKKIRAESLKNYILSSGAITGSISNALSSDTASYILYSGIPNGTSSNSVTASYSISSSWSNAGYWALYSDTASYIYAPNIDGSVPSSSYSETASYLNYHYKNGRIEYAQTASYCENANTSSYLLYIPGIVNGTASYAMSCSSQPSFNGSASYLNYHYQNGRIEHAQTASYCENAKTASYILYTGVFNGTVSYSLTSSISISSSYASQSSFLNYNGTYNGTASHALTTDYCDFANVSNISLYCDGTASYAISSSVSQTSSYCNGTSSYAISSSYCSGTSSHAISAEKITDPNYYRMYGPYSSDSQTTLEAYVQNFVVDTTTGAGKVTIIEALGDVKVPITQTEVDMNVNLYLDYTEPSAPWSLKLDSSKVANYINLSTTGAFTLSGYNKQSFSLAGNFDLSGSWYKLRISTDGGATVDTRSVKFIVYTRADSWTKTAFPPY